MDSFSVTDIYRNILETALKSLRKVTVNLHAHHTEKNVLNIYIYRYIYKKGKLLEELCQEQGQ